MGPLGAAGGQRRRGHPNRQRRSGPPLRAGSTGLCVEGRCGALWHVCGMCGAWALHARTNVEPWAAWARRLRPSPSPGLVTAQAARGTPLSMVRKTTAYAGWPAFVLGACLSVACSAVEEVDAQGVVTLSDDAGSRLAQVHVILQPQPDPIGVEPQLDISASFVHYRGLDEDSVRSRVGLGALPFERLDVGTCVASEALDGIELSAAEHPAVADRELVLVDAGDVTFRMGEVSGELPLVLLPDLLPYMSGVDYEQVTDVLPSVFVYDDESELSVEIEGSGDDEIPPTTLRALLPAKLDFEARRGFDASILELRWRSARRSDTPLVLRIAGYVGSEPLGAEVTCVIRDRGFFRLHLAELRSLGLGIAGEGLHLRASRYERSTFDAGEFVGGEFIVELRDSRFLVLR